MDRLGSSGKLEGKASLLFLDFPRCLVDCRSIGLLIDLANIFLLPLLEVRCPRSRSAAVATASTTCRIDLCLVGAAMRIESEMLLLLTINRCFQPVSEVALPGKLSGCMRGCAS